MQPTEPSPSVSLLGLGVAWTRVGYSVLVLALLSFALNLTVHPVLPLPAESKLPEGYRLVGGKDGGIAVRASLLGAASVFVLVFSAIGGFVWTFADVIDRRKRFVWLLPMFICPLVLGLQALPLALYLFYGRETPSLDDNV